MAYFYCDANTGSDANDGTTWAQAEATIEAVLADASAGDTIFIRANTSETVADTTPANRTITLPAASVNTNPMRVVGVKTGTTNTGASVVAADLAVRTGDQPVIEVTVAGSDLIMGGNDSAIDFSYIHFICADRFTMACDDGDANYFQCTIDTIFITAVTDGLVNVIDSLINYTAVSGGMRAAAGFHFNMRGGEVTGTITSLAVFPPSRSIYTFNGVDLSGLTMTNIIDTGSPPTVWFKFINCRLAYTNVYETTPTLNSHVELIACNNNSSARGSTTSFQDYLYADVHGEVTNEATIVRTDGADDGADGSFSYAMETNANSVLEGSFATLKSPWFSVWVLGGASKTLTVYIVNDGSGDLTEEEIYCEFYTPNASDFAWHDQNIDPLLSAFVTESTTAITDDTSTWVTVNTFKQKFSTTVTPGFEGFAYARVHLAKRQATPDIVYIDPKIEIT